MELTSRGVRHQDVKVVWPPVAVAGRYVLFPSCVLVLQDMQQSQQRTSESLTLSMLAA